VTAGGHRFAVDCGALGEEGTGVIPAVPDSLSFVVLTHAHSDHCGLLPELFASGFAGPVYCTNGTARLTPIMLDMMRGISRSKIPRGELDRTIDALVAVPYGKTIEHGGVRIRFRRAEHLLGAASVELWLPAGADTVALVVSGDIGGGNSVLLPPLDIPENADYVIMESTYGDRRRELRGDGSPSGHEGFARAVAAALESGGDVLIPAFTLGRTQEVMAVIDRYQRAGIIPAASEIYVDSPTAHKVTEVYRELRDELSAVARELYPGEALKFPTLREVRSRTSMKVHTRRHAPTVFVSSSGDLEHANSPRHLMHMFARRENLLCIIGWQAPGSLGARLISGESPVLVRRQEGGRTVEDWISPELAVLLFDAFSGHADQAGLLRWIAGVRGTRKVFLVHGEERSARALAEVIRSTLGLTVEVPERGAVHTLSVTGGL
jgi:metallo-beta-lactamase family protein